MPDKKKSSPDKTLAKGRGPTKAKPPKDKAQRPESGSTKAPATSPEDWTLSDITPKMIVVGSLFTSVFLWSYWETAKELYYAWDKEPDYSHGFLVLPIALYALWARRDTLSVDKIHWSWIGILLIIASIAVRISGALFYVSAFDGWSILLWVGGVCWLMGGWRFFKWSLPAVIFLWFMIPLPHSAERFLRQPLQKIATKLSCWILQFLGQPALSEGTTIRLGDHEPLAVEEACSGMRIFVTIAVLAFAYIMVVRPTWWEKLFLILSIIPIALISNATRIVITGLLYQFVSTEWGKHFSHDFSGLLMIPFAAVLFGLVLWYLGKVMKEVEVIDLDRMYRQQTG